MCRGSKWKREIVPDHKVSFNSLHDQLLRVADFNDIVRLHRYTRIYWQWFCDEDEVGTYPQHCVSLLTTMVRYLWLYIIVLKSFLVYILDIFSAVTMLSTQAWSNEIFNQCIDIDDCIPIPFNTGRWLFVGCIIFSFLLVGHRLLRNVVAKWICLLVGIRVPEIKENHCQSGYFLRLHQRYGQSLLFSS